MYWNKISIYDSKEMWNTMSEDYSQKLKSELYYIFKLYYNNKYYKQSNPAWWSKNFKID